MSTPTRQEIIEAKLARIWAEQVQQYDAEHERKGRRYSSDPMRAAANFILAHTAPPTMAEIEWDNDKHYLAEAEHVDGYTVIMLSAESGVVQSFHYEEVDRVRYSDPEDLTPTGKRYTLTEVQDD